MIREGWSLYTALRAADLTPAPRSSAVKSPGKTGGPLARVLLDAQGNVVGVEPVPADGWGDFWSLNDNSGLSWPVLRPKAASLADPDMAERLRTLAKDIKKPNGRAARDEALREAVGGEIDPAPLADAARLGASKHRPRLLLDTIPTEVTELMRRTEILTPDAAAQIVALAAKEPALVDFLVSFLAGEGEPGKTGFKAGQLAFDLAESRAYSSRVRAGLEAALATGPTEGGPLIECGISGKEGVRHRGNFPSITLPVVGPKGTAMYSMTADARANYRYGLTEGDLASVASATVQGALDALHYVTDASRRDKHWRPFANGKGDRDLLIVYAEDVPKDTQEAIFASEPDDPTIPYETVLIPVLESLRGKRSASTEARVHLAVLRAVSPGQTQAVYARVPSAEAVIAAGKRWIEAQRRPSMVCEWRDVNGKGRTISPEMVVRLLSRHWSRDQERDSDIQAPSPADVLDFMLATGEERRGRAAELLGLAVVRGEGLIAGVGGDFRREPQRNGPADLPPRDAKKGFITRPGYADRFAYLLTLLLDALDIPMDTKPYPPTYLLGLLLALTDTLHKCYGTVVRDSVPPTLAGNGLLGIAKDQPSRALTELLDRIRPWQAWAETAAVKNPDGDWDIKRAKKALGRLSAIAPILALSFPDENYKMTDHGRALLLLGYLSKDDVADDLGAAPALTN